MLKMHRLVNRWSISIFFLFLIIKFLQLLSRFGIKANEDGWRRATRAFLRTEHSKFILTCFGLNFKSNDKSYIIKELADFFRTQPTIHWQIQYSKFSARRIKKDFIDIVYADYGQDENLQSIIPYLDKAEDFSKLNDEIKSELQQKVIEFYNETKNIPDKKRSWVLAKYLHEWLSYRTVYPREIKMQIESYLNRILSANFIQFEEIPAGNNFDSKRFEIPDFIKCKHPGAGLLNIICRFNNKTGIDLWFQCHHVAIDGRSLQDVLQELKQRWGMANRIRFPASLYENNLTPVLFSTEEDERSIYAISQVVNFFPLLRMEKVLNRRYIPEGRRGVTLLRLVIWKLGIHPVFRGYKFLIPVDIRSRVGQERSLGFVIIRPSVYFNEDKPEKGFLEFHEEFTRQVKATIFHRSETYELLERYAIFPPFIYTLTLKLIPSAVKELIGSFGVTVINHAEAFIAPYTDIHSDGFIALSNITVYPKERVASCYVNIKAPKNRINDYLMAINEIIGVKSY